MSAEKKDSNSSFGYTPNRFTKMHPNNVMVLGSYEPVLTVLDLEGAQVKDLLLLGLNDKAGSIIVDSKSRADEISRALEPLYETEVAQRGADRGSDHWWVDFNQRHMDGASGSNFIVNLTLEDGTTVIRDGRWVN